mmetsp:Transcript_9464/g.10180  ORF Transcript_9464/g.10180 Transcript_9464/m.10180 type:complete len:129 (+) Transcript_9464:168-554(+)
MPRRLYANENPQKQNAPGHGSVERAKGDMWTTSASTTSATPSTSSAAPNYKVKKYVVAKEGSGGDIMSNLGIGRGGVGGMTKKKKKKVEKTSTIKTTVTATTSVGIGREQEGGGGGGVRVNPDAGFFN